MEKLPIYTIGHGARKADELVELLQAHGILYLADVRTYPQSRFHPQFNRKPLSELLSAYGIAYLFLGEELGGRPKDPACYGDDGKVDYALLSQTPLFRLGIAQLHDAYRRNLPVALMCSERRPEECHRSRLIGAFLSREGIPVVHIDEHGRLKSQETVEKGFGHQGDLFAEK